MTLDPGEGPAPLCRATTGRRAGRLAAAGLAGIGVLHVAWGLGSSWPARDRATLSDAVVGSPLLEARATVPCFTVAGLLATASVLVADPAWLPRRPRALGVLGVTAVLAARGVVGAAGRTDLLSPGSTGPLFRQLDRRLYSPLCLTLAALCAASLRRRPLTTAVIPPRTVAG